MFIVLNNPSSPVGLAVRLKQQTNKPTLTGHYQVVKVNINQRVEISDKKYHTIHALGKDSKDIFLMEFLQSGIKVLR